MIHGCQTPVFSSQSEQRQRKRERQLTLTRTQACQSEQKKSNKERKGGRRERNSLPVGQTKKMWRQRRSKKEWGREQCRQNPLETTWKEGMFYFLCIESVQLWVILPLGRLIACWSNALSPPVLENQHIWWVIEPMCFFFCRTGTPGLLQSKYSQIRVKDFGLSSKFKKRNAMQPAAARLTARPWRLY